MRFNPDIVFVEKTINRQILDFLSHRGIAVIAGLKKQDIQKIVHISGMRSTIKNVWTVERYKPSRVVGSIDLMHIRKFDKNCEPIIYFEKNIGVYTLLISERTQEQQMLLKRAVRVLLKLMRQVHLEKYLVHVDFDMWEGKEPRSVPKIQRISPRYLSSLERMKEEEVCFYKMRLG